MQIFSKKTYVVPTMQIVQTEVCGFLAASNDNKNEIDVERYNYLCPYIPETRCREYNRFVRRKRGILSLSSKTDKYQRISVKGKENCPYKDSCIRYKNYCELVNGKQY